MKSCLYKIEIRNFKAFREPFTLDLGGRHLLVYGSNGSGKSSLYWALYTFLQSAGKQPRDPRGQTVLRGNRLASPSMEPTRFRGGACSENGETRGRQRFLPTRSSRHGDREAMADADGWRGGLNFLGFPGPCIRNGFFGQKKRAGSPDPI